VNPNPNPRRRCTEAVRAALPRLCAAVVGDSESLTPMEPEARAQAAALLECIESDLGEAQWGGA